MPKTCCGLGIFFSFFFLSDQKRMSEKVPLRLSRDGDVVDK